MSDNNQPLPDQMPEEHRIILNDIKRELAHVDQMTFHDRVEAYSSFSAAKKRRILDYGLNRITNYTDLNETEKSALRPRVAIGVLGLAGALMPLVNPFFDVINRKKRRPIPLMVKFFLGNIIAFTTMNESCSYIGMREEVKKKHSTEVLLDEIRDM